MSDTGLTPQDIQIKKYSATRSLATTIWVVGALAGSVGLFLGIYFMSEMRRPGMMMTLCFGGGAISYWIGKLFSEGLLLMVDQTQAAQASVVLERERMGSDEKS